MNKILKLLKNFYIVFSVCFLAVIIVSVSVIYKNVKEQSVKKMALDVPYTYYEPKKEETVFASNEKKDVKKEDKNITYKKEENSAVNVMSVIQEEFKIKKPVSGEIINKFSGNELVYSKTLKDFRTHNGIDIKCEKGEAVLASYSGVIEDVYADVLEGIVVVINHGNGYKTVYKNLSTDKMVKKGEPVTEGHAISGVGETAVFEAEEESHIHFELLYNDKYINPEEFME